MNLQNLHHTQVARAYRDGDIRKEVMDFVHSKCREYIASRGANEYWSPQRSNRFRSHVLDEYVESLRNPHDKTFAQDPTGEAAIKRIMRAVATH